MSGDRSGEWTVSMAQWPAPVCCYESGQDGAVLRGVNDAFESTFGAATTGQQLDAALRSLGLSIEAANADLEAWLERADRGPVRVMASNAGTAGATAYSLHAIERDADASSFLVFAPLPASATQPQTADSVEVGHLASVLSHDLRNPLDVAKARLRAGREDGDDEHFEHVARAHDRMERIVDDVLTLAQDRNAFDPGPGVALEPLVDAAWDAVETGAAELAIEGSLPTVVADRDRAARLFENLFRNAVEHGHPPSKSDSPVTVTVDRLDPDDADGCGVYVADDGTGIAPERRDRVFEPGYSTDEHGTGLGLAIVDRIATLHGWSIAVASSADAGARFELTGLERTTEADRKA